MGLKLDRGSLQTEEASASGSVLEGVWINVTLIQVLRNSLPNTVGSAKSEAPTNGIVTVAREWVDKATCCEYSGRVGEVHGVSSGDDLGTQPPVSHGVTSTIDHLHPSNELRLRMILPQELVDEILVHLQHDIQALENCSLVAKSWTYPSQKLLYTYVFICPFKYETWQEIASPATAKLLQHVHSLHCFRFNSLHDFHEDYLKSFHRLQKLDLDEVDHFELDAVNLFPAFENSLSSLLIYHLSFNLDAFIKLLCYFPNLRYLQLFDLTFDTEHLTTPPPSSTPLRGTLSLHAFSLENTDILLRVLCQLELEYDKLEIDGVLVDHSPSHVRSIISTCGKTLTHLKLGPHDGKLHTLYNSITSIA